MSEGQTPCGSCGAALIPGVRFCGQCGAALPASRESRPGTPEFRRDRTMTIPGIPTPAAERNLTPTPARLSSDAPGHNPTTPNMGTPAVAQPASPASPAPAVAHPSLVRSGTPPPAPGDPYAGRVLEGRFRLVERMGMGGMGTVYRARHERMNKTLAVKLLNPQVSADPVVRARFQREARAASLLESPHTVAVFDFGETADGLLFLAMEYLRGRTMMQLIRDKGKLSATRSLRLVDQVLKSLEEAHAHGIVHRDIKPDNIFLVDGREGDFAKVLDFGIAKGERLADANAGGDAGPQTRGDLVVGTPEYMAPEQARGVKVDARADLWACGVVLYECMTGRLPFTGDTPVEVLVSLLERQVPSPEPGMIHPAAWQVVEKALQKKPENRFANAAEMRAAIGSALLSMTEVAITPSAAFNIPPTPHGVMEDFDQEMEDALDREAWGEFGRSQRRGKVFAFLGATTVLVGAAYLGVTNFWPAGMPTHEVEPNDVAAQATPVRPGMTMEGVLAEPASGVGDKDLFVLELPDGPQVLSATVTPSGPSTVNLGLTAWVDNRIVFRGFGKKLAHPRIPNLTVQGRVLHLMVREENLVTTTPPTPAAVPYRVLVQPLRAPTPQEEREPNGDTLEAQPLAHAQEVTGFIVPADDEDVYRLSQNGEEDELEVDVVPSAGLQISVEISSADGKRVFTRRGSGAGDRVTAKVATRRCGAPCHLKVTGEPHAGSDPAYRVVYR